MAADIYLKIDGGKIKGESKDDKHKDEIEVLAISWGASQQGTSGYGGGSGAGKVNMQDLTITKRVDASSSDLMFNLCSGAHFDEFLITLRKAGGENPLEYMKIKLNKVFVTSMQLSGSEGDVLHETVSFNFGAYHHEYFTQNDKGAGDKAGSIGWNVKENKKI